MADSSVPAPSAVESTANRSRTGRPPPFPGAVGASHLRVYDTVAPDGLAGGTPHLHTACTEAYAVLTGEGAVQTLGGHGFRELPIEAGSFVWFTPGTIHRLINRGDLEILVVMQNAGLPEAGDMVITLPPHVLADSERYAAAASLPSHEQTTAGSGDAARGRRDAAVSRFVELRASVEAGDPSPLHELYAAAGRLVAPRIEAWRAVWTAGPLAEAHRTGELLDALASGSADHLRSSSVHELPPPPDERRMGCCGTLGTYLVATTG